MKCECGGDMKHHDKAVRIVREKGGAKHRIYIERVKCEKCGKIRRIFPENILLTLFFMSMNTIFTYFRICENSYK